MHVCQTCRCFNPDACPGVSPAATNLVLNTELKPNGNQLAPPACADGYRGNLCGVCSTSYGTVRPFICRRCLKSGTTIALYILAAVVMLVAVRVLSALSLAESGPQGSANQTRPVDLAKPLVVYAQWLFILFSLSGVPWPPSLSYPLQALAWFWSSASSNSLGLDCVLPHHGRIPVAAQKVLLGLFVPVAILLVLLLFELLVMFFTLRRRASSFARAQRVTTVGRCTSLAVCLAYIFLPTWAHTAFSLFACVPLDDPATFPYAAKAVGSFWAQDMNEQCYAPNGYHRYWALGLGIPLLLVLCVLLPAGLFVFLHIAHQHGKLPERTFRQQYGFLYRSWRDGVCWWEAVVILQTILLVMIGTFGYALGPYYQLLVMATALGIIGVLLLIVKPHDCEAAGSVCLQSVGVLYLTAFAALSFLQYRNIPPPAGYTITMGVFVLLVNVLFVLLTLIKLLRLVDWDVVRRFAGRVCSYCPAIPTAGCIPHQPRTAQRLADIDVFHLRCLHSPGFPCCSTKQLQACTDGSLHSVGGTKSMH